MANRRYGAAQREVRTLFDVGTIGSLTDGQLLERFVTSRAEVGELAFVALLERHGPMVLRVCRGVLRDPNNVEDAFQATFLVLARKAGSLWVRDSIGPWLHGVAYRVATRARSDSARRQRHERRAAERCPTVSATGAEDRDDLGPVLHEEIRRLPERYRAPIVLCYLEGMTHEQAAHRLDWPVGTVRSRLARGRDRLRDRLDRRGAIFSAGLVAAGPSLKGPAVSPALIGSTALAAARFAAGGTGSAAAALAGGVLRTLALNALGKVAVPLLLVGLVAGAGAFGFDRREGGGRGTPRTIHDRGSSPPLSSELGRPRSEAEQIAERVLKAGSDLFDAKQAVPLAATYTEDGEISLTLKKEEGYRNEVTRGRADVERFYRDLFKGAGTIDSENTVEFARLVTPDLLIIHGRFRPNAGEEELPFVQVRVKREDRWQIQKLSLFPAHTSK